MSLNQVSVTVSHHYSSITLRAASRWWIGQRWLILAIVAVGQIFIIFQKSAIWKKNLRLIWSELMERVTLDTAGAKALFCSEIQTSLGGFYTIISAFARLSQSFYTSRLWCRCTWSPLGNQCMQSIHSQATYVLFIYCKFSTRTRGCQTQYHPRLIHLVSWYILVLVSNVWSGQVNYIFTSDRIPWEDGKK